MNTVITFQNDQLAFQARQAVKLQHPRKKNFTFNDLAVVAAVPLGDYQAHATCYGGWAGTEFQPMYTSCLTMDNRRAIYRYGFIGTLHQKILGAPAGTQWDHDGSIISNDLLVEYHPTLEDILARDFKGRCLRGLQEARARRKVANKLAQEQQLHELIKAREIDSVRVTILDSRRGGNCIEGTLRYAELRLKIPREQILACPWLVSVAANRLDDTLETQRAIDQAWLRETTVTI